MTAMRKKREEKKRGKGGGKVRRWRNPAPGLSLIPFHHRQRGEKEGGGDSGGKGKNKDGKAISLSQQQQLLIIQIYIYLPSGLMVTGGKGRGKLLKKKREEGNVFVARPVPSCSTFSHSTVSMVIATVAVAGKEKGGEGEKIWTQPGCML